MTSLNDLKVKIFADGADIKGIRDMAALPYISGFTTNPTLMRKAGVTDYQAFAMEAIAAVGNRPISFEVFADDLKTMEAQAMEIASWGKNVNVKIPVTNTRGFTMAPLVRKLSARGVVCNVTAIFTLAQMEEILEALVPETPAILSIFAGRIVDAGVDPVPVMAEAVRMTRTMRPLGEVLWASPREILNVVQADQTGCAIITATNDMLKKLSSLGKDLDQFSLETVEMFYNDAKAAGYDIQVAAQNTTEERTSHAA